jgi:nucleoside-diphosphate-sugar epimerase
MSKTVVITGTATGMGKAAVAKFAAEGWNVVATVRKDADLTAHQDLPGVRTLLHDVNDETAAEVIYQAATDPDPVRVRYYSAPDSTAIPRAKQILGHDGYWREFREFVYGRPSPLWKTLTPTPGGKPVEWVLS